MNRKLRRGPLRDWEDLMLASYADQLYHEALDPLYEKFQEWHAGEVSHLDLDASIHFVHRELQKIYGLLHERRQDLAAIVTLTPWYQAWVKDNPPPGDD